MSLSKRQKRKKQRIPRRKLMKKEARLQSARTTDRIAKYTGKNIVRRYSKWFGVDLLCAIKELRLLGVEVDEGYENQVKTSLQVLVKGRQRKKAERKQREIEEMYSDSDDTFAFIAGYTSNEVPYGMTWEELGEEPPWQTENIEQII